MILIVIVKLALCFQFLKRPLAMLVLAHLLLSSDRLGGIKTWFLRFITETGSDRRGVFGGILLCAPRPIQRYMDHRDPTSFRKVRSSSMFLRRPLAMLVLAPLLLSSEGLGGYKRGFCGLSRKPEVIGGKCLGVFCSITSDLSNGTWIVVIGCHPRKLGRHLCFSVCLSVCLLR